MILETTIHPATPDEFSQSMSWGLTASRNGGLTGVQSECECNLGYLMFSERALTLSEVE